MQQRRQELAAIADALEEMAKHIRELSIDNEGKCKSARAQEGKTPSSAASSREEEKLQAGARVRVIVAGRYRHRTGTLVSRRGSTFWNIQLDARDGEVEKIIYKKDSSLRRIG
jgi:hypothetical protein